ncbi:hypothetical protein M569_08569, partial [Genlisea aurea]
MGDGDPPPEEFRCKRTDGRRWRCKRRAMDGRTLCDIHHLQGKHRQNKEKVPESLKLERTVRQKRENGIVECSRRILKKAKLQTAGLVEKKRRRRVSEALDDALKKMKLKRGDLQLELIRVFLKRQVEKKKEKEKEKEKEKAQEVEENAPENETRELPNGVMAISGSSSSGLLNHCKYGGLDFKVGDGSYDKSVLQRHFRSKNIEPLPISTVKAVPFVELLNKKKTKRCHFCRESKYGCLIKCLACKKRFFCVDCIKKRHLKKQEVKVRCPACSGLCRCKICMKQRVKAYNHKVCYGDGRKLDRKYLLHYLIYRLLPLLKKVNIDHSSELTTESRVTGKNDSFDLFFHALSLLKSNVCCREISKNGSCETSKPRRSKKRKMDSSDDNISINENDSRDNPLQILGTSKYCAVPCPPLIAGGCGESLLDLRCLFPFNWTRDLEVKAEELLCNYHVPEPAEVSSCCSFCSEGHSADSATKQREVTRRIGFEDNYLYSPTVKDLHQEKLEHFQSHWGKGQPVIVRNVLRSNTGLSWDPTSMLCTYMENKSSESCKSADTSNCLDWCEVEIVRKRIFMGSLEKRTHASLYRKFVKFKTWLSSNLFRKQFPVHYKEILSSLPLPEYVHPMSGLLNVGVMKVPEDWPEPDLGPSVFLSYGSQEELKQIEFLSKLSCESHDTVNLLVYATSNPISPEKICKIQTLMKSLQHISQKIPFHPSVPKGQFQRVANGNISDEDESDTESSILYCGSLENSEDFSEHLASEDIESRIANDDQQENNTCGACWDIFSRQDVPKLQEYIRRHSSELGSTSDQSKLVHPIFDEKFFLDAYHKLKLKEEFGVQPWSFEQFTGEAIFIPAGCPYQVRNLK